jgi:hypothetical protein
MINIPIPAQLFKEKELIRPSDLTHIIYDLRISQKGNLYCLSHLFFRYLENGNEDSKHTSIVSIYDLNSKLISQVILDNLSLSVERDSEGKYQYDKIRHMALLNNGQVAFFSEKNRTFVYDEFLENMLFEYDLIEPNFPTIMRSLKDIYIYNFASNAITDNQGRLLCSIKEKEPRSAFFIPSTIVVTEKDYSLTKEDKPIMTYITHVDKTERKAELVRLMGLKKANEDFPSLPDQISKRYSLPYFRRWFGWPVPISDGRFIIGAFEGESKVSNKGSDFMYSIVSYEGEFIAALEGFDLRADSPYPGGHFNIYYDQINNKILYKTLSAFYIFDVNGKLVKRISLEEGELKFLSKFRLEGITPLGELLFYKMDQYTLVKAKSFNDLESAEEILNELVMRYKKNIRDAKKLYDPIGNYWLNEQEVKVI